ncbi:MAG: hypothetical protein CMB96_03630 [Flavobacteriaceae bacterium]|nr:hypothetical protein [Flavobacteriaceae bacterium]
MKKEIISIYLIILSLVLSANFSIAQVQLGQNIWGDNHQDRFGAALSIANSDGTLAVGAYRADDNGVESGLARIFQFDGNLWNQVGNDLIGDSAGDWLGYSIDLNDDGQIFVVGAPRSNDNGVIRVYQWNEFINDWEQLGQDIIGENIGDNFGYSCSINSAGDIVAASGPFNNDSANDSGSTRVFQYNGSSWDQLGQDIDGEYDEENSGHSVDLSSNGYILSIGAGHNSEFGFEIGQNRVYSYNLSSNSWIQIGQDINGEGPYLDHFGYSNSISSDGYTVAVGAPQNNTQNGIDIGHVRVFKFDGLNWVQVGMDIDGIGNGNAGWDLSISGDGSILILGSPTSSPNGASSGKAIIYQLDSTNWNQIGTINGLSQEDFLGACTDINRAGTKIAVSSTLANDSSGQLTGLVQVYDIQSALNTNNIMASVKPVFFPNPSNSIIKLNSENNYKIQLFDINGKLLYENIGNSLDISKLDNALYIVKLVDIINNQSFELRVIKN